MGSADWMPRNLDRRVEIVFPVEAPDLKEKAKHILDVQLRDTLKAHCLLEDGTYRKVDRRGKEAVEAPVHLRCRRVGTLRLLRRAGFARGDGLRRGKAVRLSRQTLRMAQLRADRVSDIRYDSCKRTVVFGSRGHLSPCFVRSGREMRLYLLSGPDCVMAKSASGHSKTEGCRFSVHGAASRGPEAMHPASCAGVKKTTGPEMNRVRSLFSGVYG